MKALLFGIFLVVSTTALSQSRIVADTAGYMGQRIALCDSVGHDVVHSIYCATEGAKAVVNEWTVGSVHYKAFTDNQTNLLFCLRCNRYYKRIATTVADTLRTRVGR